MAFQPRKTGDVRGGAGGSGGEDDGVGGEIPRQRLYGELIHVGQAHGFGGHELHPQRLCPFDAPALQFGPGDGFGKAVVILDEFGTVQRTGPLGENGRLDPCAGGVQRRRYPRRAGTDDNDVRHG